MYHDVANVPKQGLMSSWIVEMPLVVVSMDLMEFLPIKSQNKCLIVFQDLFIHCIEVKPLRPRQLHELLKS